MQELDVPFKAIACGKMRRYFSLQNLVDLFKIPLGILQALFILRKFRPRAIFCKGGYVSFPVAVAGKILKIPVVLHESDVSPGLGNRLCAHFADVICVSFEETKKYFPRTKRATQKVVVTGNPLRRELAFANREEGLKFCDFKGGAKQSPHPIVLCIGGSLGADFTNQVIFENLDRLLKNYQVIHICGQGKVKDPQELLKFLSNQDEKLLENYRSFAFVGHELKHLYAAADVIVSRAGAISLAEIDFFEKPSLLIPLPKTSSRGDQIENARAFARDHHCKILPQENYTPAIFLEYLEELLPARASAHTRTNTPVHELAPARTHTRNPARNKFAALEKIIHLLEKI